MRTIFSPEELDAPLAHPIATVGNFDGVHRGHQRILETIVRRAAAAGGTSVLVSFHPHPQQVLHPDSAPRLISTPKQKRQHLAAAGLDMMLDLPFTRELAALSPEEFVTRILLRGLGAREIHIGRNFRFGRDRAGDFETLARLGRERGFVAMPMPGVRHDGERISSSRVRHALAQGNVVLAATLLGREEELQGRVVPGDARGRTIGFPTANLEIENELTPCTGVYVTRFAADDGEWPSVTNIGSRPTFPGARPAIESHLLGFRGDLYGKQVAVRFVHRLRDEMKFAGVDALQAQIEIDVEQARRLLGG